MWSKCTNIFDLYSGIPQKQPEITINFSSTLHTADSELGYKSSSCWIDSDQCWHWDEENLDSLRWNWKVRQLPGIKPKYLACAASGLPLSCDNQTTTNTHNLLYVLHRSHTWVSAVRTSLGVDWKFYSVYFSLFNWENHSAWAFCWWREFSSQTLTGNIVLPPVQYIRVEDCENWRLSGCCSLVAEHWLHAQCPVLNCWWLLAFSLSSNFISKTSLSQREARVLSSWSWHFTILSISLWRWVQSDYNQDLFLLCESLSTAALTTCTFPQHLPQ